jgi:hypothetical protein
MIYRIMQASNKQIKGIHGRHRHAIQTRHACNRDVLVALEIKYRLAGYTREFLADNDNALRLHEAIRVVELPVSHVEPSSEPLSRPRRAVKRAVKRVI